MMPILIAAAIAITVFVVLVFFMPSLLGGQSDSRKKSVLARIHAERESSAENAAGAGINVLRDYQLSESDFFNSILGMIPAADKINALLLKAGVQLTFANFIGLSLLVMLIVAFALNQVVGLGLLSVPVAIIAVSFGSYKFLQSKIDKRNFTFINMFPDAVDMIVRSVRSGHPLSAALRMISDNMDPPVSTEFKQVVDEIAYGRTLTEALHRLSKRIDQPDLNFFVVVLSVQQETGGNLSEVLSNLSNILRKRKQLRLKIRAMTSEGRMTAYILGSLPFFLVLVLHITSPAYLVPLFETGAGKIIIAVSISLVALAGYIVKKMINIDI